MTNEQILKEQIKELCKLYEYTDIDRITTTIVYEARWGVFGEHKPISWYNTRRELAEAIKALRHCSNIQIQGTHKGISEKVSINEGDTRNIICLSLEESLSQYEWTDDLKDEFILIPKDCKFTDEDLNEIINECKNIQKDYDKFSDKGKYGKFLSSFYSWMEENNITTGKKLKAYSFMYDILVLFQKAPFIGIEYKGEIGKDKYQHVKNLIHIFQVQLRTQKDTL